MYRLYCILSAVSIIMINQKQNKGKQNIGSSLLLPAYGRVGQGQHSLVAHFAKRNTKNCGGEKRSGESEIPSPQPPSFLPALAFPPPPNFVFRFAKCAAKECCPCPSRPYAGNGFAPSIIITYFGLYHNRIYNTNRYVKINLLKRI